MKNFLLKYSIVIVFIVILILGFFSGISLDNLWDTLRNLKVWQISILVLWYLLIAVITILGKKVLLRFLGYSVGLKNISLIHFASISAHYSTPAKIGFPVTVYLLNKMEKVPVSVSTAAIALELFASVLLTGLIGLVGTLMYFSDIVYEISRSIIFAIAILAVVILISLLIYYRSKKLRTFINKIGLSIKLLKLPKLIVYFSIQILLRLAGTVHIMLITYYLGGEITFWFAIIASSSAYIIGAISMVPMGLGTRDLSLVFYLTSFGLTSDVAIMVTAVQRVISTGLGYLFGIVAGSILGLESIKKTDS